MTNWLICTIYLKHVFTKTAGCFIPLKGEKKSWDLGPVRQRDVAWGKMSLNLCAAASLRRCSSQLDNEFLPVTKVRFNGDRVTYQRSWLKLGGGRPMIEWNYAKFIEIFRRHDVSLHQQKDIDFSDALISCYNNSSHPTIVEREDNQGSAGKISYGDRGCVFKNAML